MKAISVAAAALFWLGSLATDVLTADKLEADIKTEELQRNLWNFAQIASQNGGNRAFGLPGYKASMDYVLERAKTRFAPEYDTFVQEFNHTFEQTKKIAVTGPAGEDVYVLTLFYNHATPGGQVVTAELIDTPVDDEQGSGCFAEQWEGIDATGKLALVKRGVCAISDKLKLARAHGALGVVLYNQNPGTAYGSATLGAENVGLLVPAGIVPLEVGSAWSARLAAGESLTVGLLVDSVFEVRTTWNVIAETKEGDPNNVIMLGAHLDSVQQGPGINDDGSGSTALLEIMTALRVYKGYKNKVRFAWWGAEESGLIGSLYYTSHLSVEEAAKIRFYFNYDMIGSPSPFYHVYQSKPEDGSGASLLLDYLKARGKPAELAGFGSSSDYVGFLSLGIPSSGLFTGSAAAQDPCYHQACDGLDNISWEALTLNAKAAARAVAAFALSLDGVAAKRSAREMISRNAFSKKNLLRDQFRRWEVEAVREAEETHMCGEKGAKIV